MATKTIITISRQFGSGGRIIGKKLADRLNIPFYDKEIIDIAVQEKGFDKEVFEREDGKTSRGFYLLGAIGYAIGSPITITPEMSLNDQIFKMQSEIIEEIAQKGACVIVGRCADYVLQNYDNIITIFIHADMDDRVTRALEEYNLEETALEDVPDFINKVDKQRNHYYHYYTNRKWGNVNNYDIALDSSKFGIDKCVTIIESLLKE